MKNSQKIGILLFSLVLLFTGCSTVSLNSNLAYPISMTREISEEYNIVSHFEVNQKAFFTLGGLITLKEIEFDQLVNAEIIRYNGDGAVNVKIVDQYNATDRLINVGLSTAGVLIGYATAGSTNSLWGSILPLLVSSRTVTVEGDIIKRIK
ncbi:MAG: hypothetical protein KAH15_05560 [Candidatus Marinimicrobia bacterium]|nr:hypothetical protein [Candidatus Neomarinimicrobiota bacterium]